MPITYRMLQLGTACGLLWYWSRRITFYLQLFQFQPPSHHAICNRPTCIYTLTVVLILQQNLDNTSVLPISFFLSFFLNLILYFLSSFFLVFHSVNFSSFFFHFFPGNSLSFPPHSLSTFYLLSFEILLNFKSTICIFILL